MADMRELIARLEAADVGGQELNGLIFRALADDPSGKDHWFMSCGELMTEDNADSITTSLDAALALAERVLPGCGWSVSMDDRMGWYQSDIGKDHYLFAGEPSRSLARTPALALCIAILKAIQHARSSTAGCEGEAAVSPNLKAKAQGEGGQKKTPPCTAGLPEVAKQNWPEAQSSPTPSGMKIRIDEPFTQATPHDKTLTPTTPPDGEGRHD